ncbi:lipoyl(octanoyl) transferase LipB [Spirulina major]|uniref:lipoyl(octanoyl) transferase LipB n=1 Tax=Spirulina major TaxID=270636 RepID=UPI0009340B41|nr:lipoyl(octanoyl) transferase LipB [Spirulina major]
MTDSLPGCYLYLLDCWEYPTVWQWQRALLKARLDNPALADVLLLVEHPPVYTLGTGSTLDHLKFDPAQSPAALHRTERGGEVTYHCPGQLVGYPIVNLCRHQPDLHWYLRQLEAVIIQTLAAFGVQGERVPGLTGVWVEGVKVAAIGIKVKRWITMHGFALNVCPDLAGFEQIVPCGIRDRAVGSLVQFVPEVTMAQVRAQVILAFEQIFHCRLLPQVGLPVV